MNKTHHKFYIGDCMDVLRALPDGAVNCCITSPPYWGLRDYGVDGQLGLEPTPEEYVAKMVEVFREVRRVLRDDGTLWLNLGDTYNGLKVGNTETTKNPGAVTDNFVKSLAPGLKPKDLVGIPWLVAFALRSDGWYLRSDIIWHKGNAMPESVTDRPTKAHEYIFLLSKSRRYWYDAEAVKEDAEWNRWGDQTINEEQQGAAKWIKPKTKQDLVGKRTYEGFNGRYQPTLKRNKRTVWTIATEPFSEAHFATFPTALVEPCAKAGCPEGGTVLDPFGGSGTVAKVAAEHGRNSIYIDLNKEYLQLALGRLGFNEDRLFDCHSYEVIGV